MQKIKTYISKLRTTITESFPEGDNLFKVEGLKKQTIVDCLDTSYSLIEKLSESTDKYEVIILKKNLISIFSELNKEANWIKKGFTSEKTTSAVIDLIFDLSNKIHTTYLIVVDGCVRTEAELISLQRDIVEYKDIKQDYLIISEEIAEHKNSITSICEDLTDFHSQMKDKNESSSLMHDELTSYHKESSEIQSELIDINVFISEHKEDISSLQGQFNSLVKNSRVEHEKLKASNEANEQVLSDIDVLNKALATQKVEIENILADANRVSMASSFLKRKMELDKPIRNSSIIMNISLVCICVLSFYLLKDSGFGSKNFEIMEFFIKLPMIAPFIWMAWSNNQRNNYLVRIQEDYAFKAASAMAFEGYNKQVQDVDENLQIRLLTLAVENMGVNPIRLFEKNIKNSPVSDISDSSASMFKEIFNVVKPKGGSKQSEDIL